MEAEQSPKVISQIRQAFDLYEEHQKFDEFMQKSSCGQFTLQQMINVLDQYFKKSDAKKKGNQLFQSLRLNDKSKAQLLIQYLINGKHRVEIIKEVQDFISQGNRKKVKQLLILQLGKSEGSSRFNKIKQQIKKQKDIVKGSIQLKPENSLKMYKFPSQDIQNTKDTKNVIFFGETGCGKSTFINAAFNFILGVQSDDQFRYKVIIDKQDSINSQTSEVSDYYIRSKSQGITYRLIDTPGFGDTNGFSTDQQTIQQIKLKINQLSSIHLLIFVLKSSQFRLNDYQRYVMLSVMNLFTRQCIPNIFFLLTFSDGGKSTVLNILQEKFQDLFQIIQKPKYIQINNSCIFQPINEQVKDQRWDNTFDAMETLFKKIDQIQPVSLNFSKKYFHQQQKFARVLQQFHSKIQLIDMCAQKIVAYFDDNTKIYVQMMENQNSNKIIKIQHKNIPTTMPVLRCINCKQINCHDLCNQPVFGKDPNDPSTCNQIDKNGWCLKCKCHVAQHKKIKQKVEKFQTISYKTDQRISTKYFQSKSKLNAQSKDFEYALYKYKSGFEEIKNKLVQLSNLKIKIQQNGILKLQQLFLAKIRYVELLKRSKTQNVEQIQAFRLQNEHIYLTQSLNFCEIPKKKLEFLKDLINKNTKNGQYFKEEMLLIYSTIIDSINEINSSFQTTSINNIEDNHYQSSRFFTNENESQKEEQKKQLYQCFLNRNCCCSFIKCIFCCCCFCF